MKKAIIYVRGNKKEMQEIFCKLYALEQGYNILFATNDINEVKDCDILLISNPSRISRDNVKYYEIVNELKKKGIEVVSVTNQDGAEEHLFFAMDLLR